MSTCNNNCKKVILASASPRRRELISLVLSDVEAVTSPFDESNVPDDLGPYEHVLYSARMKAETVAQDASDALVIGADTIVVADNTILGKPRDTVCAQDMLKMLSGRTHQVVTGLAVVCDGQVVSASESTDVTFTTLDDETIRAYVETKEPMDKAGAYAIQGKGSVLIERIDGCYFNVVGLPVYRLAESLGEFGYRRFGMGGCFKVT